MGIDPMASRMRNERSTTELTPLDTSSVPKLLRRISKQVGKY